MLELAGLGVGIVALAIIRRPLVRRIRYRIRRQRMLRAYATAARDPEFLEADGEIIRAFDSTVGDGLKRAVPTA